MPEPADFGPGFQWGVTEWGETGAYQVLDVLLPTATGESLLPTATGESLLPTATGESILR